MSDSTSIEERFKIGVLKELHMRNLIARDELDRTIKIATKKSITVYVHDYRNKQYK